MHHHERGWPTGWPLLTCWPTRQRTMRHAEPVFRLAALVIACSLPVGCSSSTDESVSIKTPSAVSTKASQPRPLSGLVVLDGSVNGCGGEQIAVQVRDDTGVIGSSFANSKVVGFDCTYRFRVDVPRQSCYALLIDSHPVGRYPESALNNEGGVGVITSDSVWGDPEAANPIQKAGLSCPWHQPQPMTQGTRSAG